MTKEELARHGRLGGSRGSAMLWVRLATFSKPWNKILKDICLVEIAEVMVRQNAVSCPHQGLALADAH